MIFSKILCHCYTQVTVKTWCINLVKRQEAVWDRSYTWPITVFFESACVWGRISKETVYEYNNVFLLVWKWRKPLRNHITRIARKTCWPEFVMCQSQKRLAGSMSCASKKWNKCWSFPRWWLISACTHAAKLQKQSHFQPRSHEVGQKGRDILWLSVMTWLHWKDEEHNLPVPVYQCTGEGLVLLPRLLESVLFAITCPVCLTMSVHSPARGSVERQS